MTFVAKLAVPRPERTLFCHPLLHQIVETPLTLLNALPGYIPTACLAAALTARERPTVWLRCGPEDRDPATFLLSLIAAARQLVSHAGTTTLEQMRRRPGPVMGWPRIFTHLARELGTTLPAASALVIEHIHYLNGSHQTLALLGSHLLPALPADMTCTLTTSYDLPAATLPPRTIQYGPVDLRLGTAEAAALAVALEAPLPAAVIRRVVALSGGQADALYSLFSASTPYGADLVQRAISRAANGDDLLARTADAWLHAAGAEAWPAVALALRLEYSQPELMEAATGSSPPSDQPWLLPLMSDWSYLRPAWQPALHKTLGRSFHLDAGVIRRAAAALLHQEAVIPALQLYTELGDTSAAARTIAGAVEQMMSLGQWDTLAGWLEQLPTAELLSWPLLAYASGEAAALQGQIDLARRRFALAAALFSERDDTEGACQSLLAESTLVAWQGDGTYAQERARAASAAAEAAGLARPRSWAAWQLGCLAAASDDINSALIYFGKAGEAAGRTTDSDMADLVRLTQQLLLRLRELRHQRDLYRQAYLAADHAEHEIGASVRSLLASPSPRLDALLESQGWCHTPLILKLTMPPTVTETIEALNRPNLWQRLLGAIGLYQPPPPTAVLTTATAEAPPEAPPPTEIAIALGDLPAATPTTAAPGQPPSVEIAIALGNLTVPVPTVPMVESAAFTNGADHPLPMGQPETHGATPRLTVNLLGPLRVFLNDMPVENWPSRRGRALFKYLAHHHRQAIPREVLMDLFWPDSSPDAARNSLNVAIHGLRQAFEAISNMAVVIFLRQEGAYCINPALEVWLDVEEFERQVQEGRRQEAEGQFIAATASYEAAASLYQGEFLADDPYEEWPVLDRERLRLAYMDTIDRLSQIFFSQGQYAACSALCQKIIGRDACREDAHCRLMCCYSRQGQRNLALRQYQICIKALSDDLGVEPDPVTIQLYERIRQGQPV